MSEPEPNFTGVKPCPFCGKRNPMLCFDEATMEYSLHCIGCGSRGAFKASSDLAREAWNRRA